MLTENPMIVPSAPVVAVITLATQNHNSVNNLTTRLSRVDVIGGTHVNVVVRDKDGACIDNFTHPVGSPFSPAVDTDLDGVTDMCEGKDDIDGVLNYLDPYSTTTSVATTGDLAEVTLDREAAPNAVLRDVMFIADTDPSVDEDTKPAVDFLSGLLRMTIDGLTPGQSVTATIAFPHAIPTDYEYWKYDSAKGWYRLPFGSNDGDNFIVLTLTDGGVGDGDGDGEANGVIRDPPGGPTRAPRAQTVVNEMVELTLVPESYLTDTDVGRCGVPYDPNLPAHFAHALRFQVRIVSTGGETLEGLRLRAKTLGSVAVWANTEGGMGGAGSTSIVPRSGDYADGVLSPNEAVSARLIFCLPEPQPVDFSVDVLADMLVGTPDAGVAAAILPLRADLALSTVAAPTDVETGETFTAKVRVTNSDSDPAAEVVLTSTAPAGIDVLNAQSDLSDCTIAAGQITCTTPALAAAAAFDVELSLRAANEGSFSQTLDVQAPFEIDSDATNNTLALSLTAVTPPGPPGPEPPTDQGGDNGRCFIATAAYGSYLAPEVRELRRFRDEVLLTSAPGRAFVDAYYALSPPIAAFIADHDAARAITRWALTPVVIAVKHPAAAGAGAALVLFGAIGWRTHRKSPRRMR